MRACTDEPGLCAAMGAGLLRTVLRNLVSNAVKYGARRDGARVQVLAEPEGEAVRIEVADDGPGIPPDRLPHVFDAFVRASAEPGGFGLGLATVKRLVEAHGGDVSISSRPGAGTRVRLALPCPPGSLPRGQHAAHGAG